MEVKYFFPLDGNAAVFGFKAVLPDGSVIRAKCEGKEEAKETYEKAKNQGKQAFLLERVQSDIFQMAVGNAAPGEKVTIEISYFAELSMDGGKIRLRIPNHIAPKYGGSVATHVSYPISFDFDIKLSTPIGPIEGLAGVNVNTVAYSPTHVRATASKEGFMNEDLVLLIPQQNPYGVYASIERSLEFKSECIRVTFNNEENTDEIDWDGQLEVIFLVDVSGSMHGDRMETTKKALNLFLRSIPGDNCRFNIVTFNNSHVKCFNESRTYDDDSITEAQTFVDKMYASGGTDILRPFQSVTEPLEDPEYPRSVIILTDGEVGNSKECIDAARISGCRVSTIGVGSSFSQELVEGMATAGGGIWQAVHDVNDLGAKVTRALSSILAPSVSKMKVECDTFGGDVSMTPRLLPKIQPGIRTTIYFQRPWIEERVLPPRFAINFTGVYSNGNEFQKTVEVITSDGEGVSRDDLARASIQSSSIIHRIAAMEKIRILERKRDNQTSKNEVRALGLKYNLASSETSFVAVRESKEGEETSIPTTIAPPAQRSSGSLFGSVKSKSAGLFGNSQSMMGSTGGLFGNNNSNLGGTLFGSNNTNSGGSLFGNNNNNTGSLFGSNKNSGGLFGSSNKSGGLFGSNNNSGGLFGSNNKSGGLFGSNNNTGGLFGSNNNSGGLFPRNSASNSLPASALGLFGSGSVNPSAKRRKRMNAQYEEPAAKKPKINDKLSFEWLIRQQSVTGKFVFNLTNSYFSSWEKQLKALESQLSGNEALIATIFALFLLSTEYQSREEEFKLMYKKAERWANSALKKKGANLLVNDLIQQCKTTATSV